MIPRLQEKYKQEILPALAEKFSRSNRLALPRLQKIVVNMGVGEAIQEKKYMETAVDALTQIVGQKPIITKARKSIAGFRLREEMPIGCKVTLRNRRMYEFLDRLIALAIPRVRDFRGVSAKSFDGRGNFAMGLKEQIVFPEIDYDKVDQIRGMDVVICTTAKTDDEARALLKGFDMPFSGRDPEKEKEEEAKRRAEQEAEKQAARDALKEIEDAEKPDDEDTDGEAEAKAGAKADSDSKSDDKPADKPKDRADKDAETKDSKGEDSNG